VPANAAADNTPVEAPGSGLAEFLAESAGEPFDCARVTAALLRAQGIPAYVETGIYLPQGRTPEHAEPAGDAAWVRFYVNGFDWTVCDPYAAASFPELKDRMFGGLCANRVQLAAAPEPGLAPKPKAGLPTVFTRAFAESDGKHVPVVTRFFFRDVSGGSTE
jgi:hypothetical protein